MERFGWLRCSYVQKVEAQEILIFGGKNITLFITVGPTSTGDGRQ
jgi:hypothetical protein